MDSVEDQYLTVHQTGFGVPITLVGAWLASDDARKIAIAGKPGSYGFEPIPNPPYTPAPVGAWLASDGVHQIAIAGKPGSYGLELRQTIPCLPV